MSIYVTLPSNASMAQHPNNCGGDYITELQETLDLDSRWEVGLSEVIFRQDWPNIRAGEESTIILEAINDLNIILEHSYWKRWSEWGWAQVVAHKFILHFRNRTFWFFYSRKTKPLSLAEALLSFNNAFEIVNLNGRLILRNDSVDFIKTGETENFFEYEWSSDFAALFTDLHILYATNKEELDFMHELYPDTFIPYIPTANVKKELSDPIFPRGVFLPWPKRRPAPVTESISTIKIALEEGYYESVDSLVEEVNRAMTAAIDCEKVEMKLVPLKHSSKKERCIDFSIAFKTDRDGYYWWRLTFPATLARILGMESIRGRYYIYPDRDVLFTPEEFNIKEGPITENVSNFKGIYPVDMAREMASLWIYSNIAAPQITGHGRASLLRIVPLKRNVSYGDTVMERYEKPHYLPIAYHTVDNIHIRIFNTYGLAPIRFISDVIVKLHFRRRKEEYKKTNQELQRVVWYDG